MEKLPQRLVNVRVRDRTALDGAEVVWAAVEQESEALRGRGRVLVRRSGTEPLVRVMVEAPREDECEEIVESVGEPRRSRARLIRPMCGIIGYVGSRECRDLLLQGLQRLEYRGYDSAGLSLVARRVDRQRPRRREPPEPARRGRRDEREPEGLHRHRPHALGHARARDRGQRPPALGHLRALPHRPQRDHRELDRAARPPPGRGRRVHLRDRRRGGGAPDRLAFRGRPGRGRAARLQRAARPLRVRRDVAPTSPTCSSAPARSARWSWGSARARASSRRRSPPSCRRRATCSSCTTARSWRSRRRARASSRRTGARSSARSTGSTGATSRPRRAATRPSCSRRSTSRPTQWPRRSPTGSRTTAWRSSRWARSRTSS